MDLRILTALILVTIGGEADFPVHRPALLHGSVRISYSPSQKMGTIRSITWKFDKNGKHSTILDTTEKPYYIYDSEFRERLVMSGDLYTMTIKALTLEDRGIYTVEVTDSNGITDISSFNVTVYEPTPRPTITPHMMARTSGRCNVTLNCSAPTQTSELSYSWKYRHRDSTYQPYGNGRSIQISLPPDHQDSAYQPYGNGRTIQISLPPNHRDSTYQPYGNGHTIQISLPPNHQDSTYQSYGNGHTMQISLPLDHQDMEILCIVQNPADQKNVSISISVKSCSVPGNRSDSAHLTHRVLIPTLIAVIIAMIMIAVICIWTKRKRNNEVKENTTEEINYIEVTTQPREDSQRVVLENDHYSGMPPPQKSKVETLYTMLQHPQPKHT